jgi:hypothetical protein
MKSSVTKEFRQRLGVLPFEVWEQANRAYALWQSDPYHPSLQFKRVSQRNHFIQCALGSDIVRWDYLRPITFTGSGSAHTLNTTIC